MTDTDTIARLTAELAAAQAAEAEYRRKNHALMNERDAALAGAEVRPAITAPQDGSMVRLLLDYTEGDGALEDKTQAWTIGYNTLADTGEDEWIIVGWNWSQDCWCDGRGKIIGWVPFVPEAAINPAAD